MKRYTTGSIVGQVDLVSSNSNTELDVSLVTQCYFDAPGEQTKCDFGPGPQDVYALNVVEASA